MEDVNSELNTASEKGKLILSKLENTNTNTENLSEAKESFKSEVSDMITSTKRIKDLIKEANKDGDKFMPDFNSLYDYLNNLSLLEESSLLHIMIFLVILITLFNILSVFFGNEL